MHNIVIKVWRGIVSEVYSDDPNTEIVILDEDRTDVEDIPQIELPAHQVYWRGCGVKPQFANRGPPPAGGFSRRAMSPHVAACRAFGSGAASRLGFAPRRHVAAAWVRQGKRKSTGRFARCFGIDGGLFVDDVRRHLNVPGFVGFEADHHCAVARPVVRLKGLRPQLGEAGAAFKCLEAVPLGVVRVVAAELVNARQFRHLPAHDLGQRFAGGTRMEVAGQAFGTEGRQPESGDD